MPPATPLTAHLLALSPAAFARSTQHPFLRRAGRGTLPRATLASWLLQDRLYALAYPAFVGALLAKVEMPTCAERARTLEWRVGHLLVDALVNIRREVGMFEDVLRAEFEWGRGGEGQERAEGGGAEARVETRAYIDLFAGAAAPHKSLLEGMVVLYATEKCYLEAWKYARSQVGSTAENETRETRDDVLIETLIPNWTSPEFESFVDAIGRLVDELGERADEAGSQGRSVAEAAWNQVLWAEKNFWPDM